MSNLYSCLTYFLFNEILSDPYFKILVYQQKRVYLDEYPEQKELREEFLSKNNYLLYKNRFGQKSLFLDGNFGFIGADDYLEDFTESINEYDIYFFNRWIKRN